MNIHLPLSYRWLRASGITRLVPWHFLEGDQGQAASDRFAKEHRGGRQLYWQIGSPVRDFLLPILGIFAVGGTAWGLLL